MVDCHKPKGAVEIPDCCVQCQGHRKCSKFQMFVWTVMAEPSLTKHGMVIHYHKLECFQKTWVANIQGHSEDV